jgi:hypothetical protein
MKPGFAVLLCLALLLAGCIMPGRGPPPTPTMPTTPGALYTPAQLKYILLDHYGESRFFYCDPDYYPVGRADELERAIITLPRIENETDVFSAIITRKGLHAPYSNDSILTIYREYKKLNAIPLAPMSEDTYSFSLRLGTTGEGYLVSGIIRSDGVILSEGSESAVLTCPICLAGDTMIDTPAGPVPVRNIQVGTIVWSAGENGVRVAVPVRQVVKIRVPPFHRLVHLQLSDGRELNASPGHPLMDGRFLGTLSIGDTVDGASVTGAGPVPCAGEFTYDILPGGDSGGYWANGIPLGSTLFPAPLPRPSLGEIG